MKVSKQVLLFTGVTAFILSGAPALAQDNDQADEARLLDEITVTARKREESVLEVPVSISVFSATDLADRGIASQQDLFDSTPSLTFDVNTDGRQGTNPGVRGVQSELIATNQQKVNSFVDGMPMVGSSGVLQFDGIQAVEIYRGPQSAAFGRATFAGAINYVTADAADEFSGKAEVRYSDQGERQASFAVTGPLGDALGFRLQYLTGEWGGPDEWLSSDGLEMAKEETTQVRAKLNFEFSDTAYGEIMYTRLEATDNPGAGYTLDPVNCPGADSGVWRNFMGMDVQLQSGEWNCDTSIPARGIPRNRDPLGHFVDQYDANRAFYEANVIAATTVPPMGMNPGMQGSFDFLDANMDGMLQSSEYLSQVLPGDGGTFEQALMAQSVGDPRQDTIRDRIQGELNFEVGDSLLQLMGMYVSDELDRWFETDNTDSLGSFGINMMTMQASLNGNVMSMLVSNEITEKYAEVRWISPADKRLSYTLSGSYYEYDLNGQVFNAGGAIELGLIAPNGNPVNPQSGITNSEVATNIGVSFGLKYDLTDKATLSVEGRFQSDENCGTASFGTESVKFCQETDAFLPRVALSYAASNNHQPYAQFSIGNNPAGVNIAYQDPGNILALQVASGQIANPADGFTYDGTDGVHFPTVQYDATTFPDYEEEKLYNFEIGSKGSFGDGKGTYAGAVYYMLYEDMIGAENLNWNDTTATVVADPLADPPVAGVTGGWNETNWTIFTGERTWINSGDGEFVGIELTTDYDFNDIWSVGGYLTWTSAEYKEFCSIQAPDYRDAPGGAQGGGNNIIPVLSPDNGDDVLSACGVVDGNDIPRQSEVTGNLRASATLPNDVFGLSTTIRADLRYKSSHVADHMNLQKMSPLTTLNLSASMRNENWNIRIYLNNVTDVDDPLNVSTSNYYYANADPSAASITAGSWLIVPRRPRELGITASYSF